VSIISTIPETDATIPPPVQQAGNGTLPTSWLRSFDGTTRTDFKLFAPIAYAMQAIHIAAKADGITFWTTGRYRSYAQQEALFLQRFSPGPFDPLVHRTTPSIVSRWWNGQLWYLKKRYAMAATPGTSNHGWGIADDIAEKDAAGEVVSITQLGLAWLADNAGDFGFALDIHEEPWHWHWYRPGAPTTLTQRTVDVLHDAGINVPDLSTFGFYAPDPTPPPPPEDDDMTPEQNAKLDKIEAQVDRLSKAFFVDDSVMPGYPSIFNMIAQIRTAVVTFWDGFPGQIKDGAGVLARTVKNIATKVGAKVG
jgi:hypothetical protein